MRILASIYALGTLFVATAAWSLSAQSFDLDAALWGPAPFVTNDSATAFGSYLVRNLPFLPIRHLKEGLEASLGRHLSGRDEAHITVITPPEYEQLSSKISIQEIQAMVSNTIQDTSFEAVCIGKGSAHLTAKLESTYFIVVRSEALFSLRRLIAKTFFERGGSRLSFDPELYYPHITIAYTQRDLHLQDGVIKDINSCFADLRVN